MLVLQLDVYAQSFCVLVVDYFFSFFRELYAQAVNTSMFLFVQPVVSSFICIFSYCVHSNMKTLFVSSLLPMSLLLKVAVVAPLRYLDNATMLGIFCISSNRLLEKEKHGYLIFTKKAAISCVSKFLSCNLCLEFVRFKSGKKL